MRLSELKTGERAVVVKVSGHGSFRKRITEMGFVKGRDVTVVLNAPLKDPIEYEIIGYKVSLRREEAALIEAISEEEAGEREDRTLPVIESDELLEERMQSLAEERRKHITVALVGNPNCGKTSLFNIASGSHERVGNYSGVTVDAKEGHFEYGGYSFTLVDLPGTYSLSPYSPEELCVRRNIIEGVPDVIVNVVDASNLERNLYLTTQLIDMNQRVVLALNMYDELEARGDKVDIRTLGYLLGMPVVPTEGRSGKGINDLFDTVIRIYEKSDPRLARHIHINHGSELEKSIDRVKLLIQENPDIRYKYSTRYLAIKYLENDRDIEPIIEALANRDEIAAARDEEAERMESLMGVTSMDTAIVEAKYAFIRGALKETYQQAEEGGDRRKNLTDRIDSVVTNKWLAFPIFLALLFIVFQVTFTLGDYPMQWIEWLVERFGDFVGEYMKAGWFKDLIVDGLIGGVGSVLVFLPNILFLYFFISILEDSGYMARAAFIMDKLMHRMGLHGKSFIPMIMGFGCNVPAIMATRSIESRKSRFITLLIIPFMSCAGRLPVYVLIVGAFFPRAAGAVLLGLYALGIVLAVLSAKVVSRFIREDDLPFVMELPPYRVPTAKSVLRHTWEKGRQYLRKMATTILVCSMVIWALGYFPHHSEYDSALEQQEHSYIGAIGKGIEPVLKPLGFDWRMGVGIIAGVGAKELIVSTLGVMFSAVDGSGTSPGGSASPDGSVAVVPDAGGVGMASPGGSASPDGSVAVAPDAGGVGMASSGGSASPDGSVAVAPDAGGVGMASPGGSASPDGSVAVAPDAGGVARADVVSAGEGVAVLVQASETEADSGAILGDTALQRALLRVISPAAALAFMVFVLLYFPCIATFVVIKNETGGWKWALIVCTYTILVAWVAAFITYRLALLL